MPKTIISVDINKGPIDQPTPIHNRWHPDLPPVATVKPGDDFIVECLDRTGGQIRNDDNAADICDHGITIVLDGNLMDIVEFQFVKPGKGGAFVRTRLKNVKTGQVIEHTFDSKDRVEQAIIDKKEFEFLYRQGDEFVFMDTETYDQHPMRRELVEPMLPLLKENTICSAKLHADSIISLSLPDFVVLEVKEADPWLRGSTAASQTKPAVLETGATIQVPVFVSVGEKIRIDTRTGRYVERM
jgi:elongation factor P